MTALSHKISMLKGNRTTVETVKGAGISRETFAKLQRGETVKLSTLKAIADFLGASREQWIELVIAWIQEEIGDEAKQLEIRPLTVPRAEGSDDAEKLIELLATFSPSDRHQIVLCLHKLIAAFSPAPLPPSAKRRGR